MSNEKYRTIQSNIFKEDYNFLNDEGFAMSKLIRKIIHDWVAYKKVSRQNPIKKIDGE